jgi:hypothetical protein
MSQRHTGQATILATVDDNRAGRAMLEGGAAARNVLAAVWCRSVGSSWTLELHELDGGRSLGRITEWINSGVPIWQPAPHGLAAKLLAERGLRLVLDPCVRPRTRNRRGIGYACPDAELITPAHRSREDRVPDPVLPDQPVSGDRAGNRHR